MSRSYRRSAALAAALAVGMVGRIAHADASARTPQAASRTFFEAGSETLTAHAMRELIEAAAWIRLHPRGVLLVEAHPTSARDLDRRRAEVTRWYLLSLAVLPDQIVVVPFGEAQKPARPHRRVVLTAAVTRPGSRTACTPPTGRPTMVGWSIDGGSW